MRSLKTEELFESVDDLPTELRVQLLERLLESLHPHDEATERVWKSEVRRRKKELDESGVETLEGESTLQKIRRRIRR
jgi:hypothetical protein